jgi:hypothetical protein
VDAPRLPVEEVGVACIFEALQAAVRLGRTLEVDRGAPSAGARGAYGGIPDVALDHDQVRAALVSERLFRVDGASPGGGFAPASRFWRAADGWVRTHANFPWHHEALLRAVGVSDEADLEAAIAALPAREVEADAFAAGGVAAAVRTPAEWRESEAGAAVAAEPLVARLRLGDADPRPLRRAKPGDGTDFEQRSGSAALRSDLSVHGTDNSERSEADGGAAMPAAGVRVLDLSRVIAGPVASRYLGALGADVLRIDPPHRPDLEPGRPFDTLLGKRSAFLDLRDEDGARRLEDLLAAADIVLLGYRPGALARFGLAPEDLAERHPGLVIAQLSAWGHTGPWAERRGFDSIVQAASGIASVEAAADGTPGALPCQLLDHGTGYLTAAAALDALAEQRANGGTHLARLSLARTAHWLLEGIDADRPLAGAPPSVSEIANRAPVLADAGPSSPTMVGAEPWHVPGAAFAAPVPADTTLTAVPPPGSLGGVPLAWARAARYGADDPAW